MQHDHALTDAFSSPPQVQPSTRDWQAGCVLLFNCRSSEIAGKNHAYSFPWSDLMIARMDVERQVEVALADAVWDMTLELLDEWLCAYAHNREPSDEYHTKVRALEQMLGG